MRTIILSLTLFISLHAAAELIAVDDNSFHLRVQMEVPVTPDVAYARFLEVGQWWDGNHSWFGAAGNFSLEPSAGGCFCERDGDRSALHMTVSYVNPGQEIRMVGGLGPLQGLALHGAMTFRFDTVEGRHYVTHEYRVMGFVEGGLKPLAPVVDQVQTGQVQRLGAYIDKHVAN